MLSSFEEHFGRCWIVLDNVGWGLISVKLFVQHRPTFFFDHAHMSIHWYSVYPRTSKRVSSSTSSRTLLKKAFSSLLIIHAVALLLFRLGFSSSSINSIKTEVATNFRFLHNWETAMFLFCKQIKNDCVILGYLVPRAQRPQTSTWVLQTIWHVMTWVGFVWTLELSKLSNISQRWVMLHPFKRTLNIVGFYKRA